MAWIPENYPRAMVLGEGGGHELIVRDHIWTPDIQIPLRIDRAGDLIREVMGSVQDLDERYSLWIDNLNLLRKYGMNAVVYTQISDVENELNGWLTYDRKVSKLPAERFAELHGKLYKPVPSGGKFIVPLSMNAPQKWMYAFEAPSGEFYKEGAKMKWQTGNGPFGRQAMGHPEVNTKWEGNTLYLQKEFSLSALPSKVSVVAYNHGVTDVYINGELAIQINNLRRWDPEIKVSEVMLPEKAMKLLKKGTNQVGIKFEFGTINQYSTYSSMAATANYFDLGLIAY
jgi:hypothetical protein